MTMRRPSRPTTQRAGAAQPSSRLRAAPSVAQTRPAPDMNTAAKYLMMALGFKVVPACANQAGRRSIRQESVDRARRARRDERFRGLQAAGGVGDRLQHRRRDGLRERRGRHRHRPSPRRGSGVREAETAPGPAAADAHVPDRRRRMAFLFSAAAWR